MSNDLTPMKRFGTNLKKFKSYLANFKTKDFNKSAAKNSYYHSEDYTTKGVANDYVLVFQSTYPNASLGLTFQFLNLPVEEQYVLASIKKGLGPNDITYSEKISLPTFKTLINEFNTWAQEVENKTHSNIDQFTIFNKFSDLFLLQTLDMKKEVEAIEAKESIILKEKTEKFNIVELTQTSLKADSDLKAAQAQILKEITNSKENKELERLMLEMHQLKEALTIKTKVLHSSLQLDQLMSDSDKAADALEYAKYQMDTEFKYEVLNPEDIKTVVKKKMR